MSRNKNRPDQDGTHRLAFERNKKKIYATQTVCGICGQPVDFSLKYPHPLSPCIDHIIPIAKGGHPSDLENLQLAHWTCNRTSCFDQRKPMVLERWKQCPTGFCPSQWTGRVIKPGKPGGVYPPPPPPLRGSRRHYEYFLTNFIWPRLRRSKSKKEARPWLKKRALTTCAAS